MSPMQTRREILRGIATGTAVVGASTGVASARFVDDEDEPGEVRVVHASPDAPAVDVFVNGNAVLEGVPFTGVSDYLELEPGDYDVALAPAGAGVEAAVLEATLPVEADTAYTVAATDTLDSIQVEVFEDDRDPFPPSEERIRAIHLSPDAPDVDIALTDGPGIRHPVVVAESLSFTDATGYLDLIPTEYSLAIRPAGSEESVAELAADVANGQTLTLLAVGLLEAPDDEQAFDVLVAEDVAPIKARLQARFGD